MIRKTSWNCNGYNNALKNLRALVATTSWKPAAIDVNWMNPQKWCPYKLPFLSISVAGDFVTCDIVGLVTWGVCQEGSPSHQQLVPQETSDSCLACRYVSFRIFECILGCLMCFRYGRSISCHFMCTFRWAWKECAKQRATHLSASGKAGGLPELMHSRMHAQIHREDT